MFRQNSHSTDLNFKQQVLAKSIAKKILKWQLRIAKSLNNKTKHFSKTKKELLLIALSIFFGGLSLYLIFSAII